MRIRANLQKFWLLLQTFKSFSYVCACAESIEKVMGNGHEILVLVLQQLLTLGACARGTIVVRLFNSYHASCAGTYSSSQIKVYIA